MDAFDLGLTMKNSEGVDLKEVTLPDLCILFLIDMLFNLCLNCAGAL